MIENSELNSQFCHYMRPKWEQKRIALPLMAKLNHKRPEDNKTMPALLMISECIYSTIISFMISIKRRKRRRLIEGRNSVQG